MPPFCAQPTPMCSWKHCVRSTSCFRWEQGTWACERLLPATELSSFPYLRFSVTLMSRAGLKILRGPLEALVLPPLSSPPAPYPYPLPSCLRSLAGTDRAVASVCLGLLALLPAVAWLQDARAGALCLFAAGRLAKWFQQVCSKWVHVCVMYIY